jgi:hypothetical protein
MYPSTSAGHRRAHVQTTSLAVLKRRKMLFSLKIVTLLVNLALSQGGLVYGLRTLRLL